MPLQRRYDAVVFDLLTALLDSWSTWNSAAGSPELGLRWRRKYLELTYGAGAYRAYEEIVSQAGRLSGMDDGAAGRLLAAWDQLPPWTEAPEVLASLAARVPLAVATNCSAALGRRAVSLLGVPFHTVVTAEDAGFYKPRPEPYRAVLENLGTAPARTLFVAGSAADVPGARGVGMPVYWHNRMRLARVDAAEPEFEYASLTPLLDLVA